MSGDDWFKIYEGSEKQESFVILKGLLDDYRKMREKSRKKAEREKKKKAKEKLKIEKSKLRKIMKMDLVLEYRFVLYYMSWSTHLGPRKEKHERERIFRLASHSMEYTTFLQEMLVKMGEKSGKLDFPYVIETKEPGEMAKSQIYVEKKVLAMYRSILKEFDTDPWLKQALHYTIDMKARHLDLLKTDSKAIIKK